MGYIDTASIGEIDRLAEEIAVFDPTFDINKFKRFNDIGKRKYIKAFLNKNFALINWNYVKQSKGVPSKALKEVREKMKDKIIFSSHWKDFSKMTKEERERIILNELQNDPSLIGYRVEPLSKEFEALLIKRINEIAPKLDPLHILDLIIWNFNDICDRNRGELTQEADFYNGREYELLFHIIRASILKNLLPTNKLINLPKELALIPDAEITLPIKKFAEIIINHFGIELLYVLFNRFNLDILENKYIYYPHYHKLDYFDVMLNPLQNQIEFIDREGIMYITPNISHKEFMRGDFLIDSIIEGKLPRKIVKDDPIFNLKLAELTERKNKDVLGFLMQIGAQKSKLILSLYQKEVLLNVTRSMERDNDLAPFSSFDTMNEVKLKEFCEIIASLSQDDLNFLQDEIEYLIQHDIFSKDNWFEEWKAKMRDYLTNESQRLKN